MVYLTLSVGSWRGVARTGRVLPGFGESERFFVKHPMAGRAKAEGDGRKEPTGLKPESEVQPPSSLRWIADPDAFKARDSSLWGQTITFEIPRIAELHSALPTATRYSKTERLRTGSPRSCKGNCSQTGGTAPLYLCPDSGRLSQAICRWSYCCCCSPSLAGASGSAPIVPTRLRRYSGDSTCSSLPRAHSSRVCSFIRSATSV